MALPYKVKYCRKSWNYEWDQEMSIVETLEDIDKDGYINNTKVYNIEDIKPYLCPMSSMTDEEDDTYRNLLGYEPTDFPNSEESLDFALKKHVDFLGLIPMGSAIEVTNENNPYKS